MSRRLIISTAPMHELNKLGMEFIVCDVDNTFPATFAEHPDLGVLAVNVLDVQPGQFTNPKPCQDENAQNKLCDIRL